MCIKVSVQALRRVIVGSVGLEWGTGLKVRIRRAPYVALVWAGLRKEITRNERKVAERRAFVLCISKIRF